MSLHLVPKTELWLQASYSVRPLRCVGPANSPTDGSPTAAATAETSRTFSNAQAALENTATNVPAGPVDRPRMCTSRSGPRRMPSAASSRPVTKEYDVPLMISRGFSSETFLL